MRVWRYQSVPRLAWVVLALLVLAVAVFAMAAGFSRLRSGAVPSGTGGRSEASAAWLPERAIAGVAPASVDAASVFEADGPVALLASDTPR